MNRYLDLRDGCSNTLFTTGSLFSLDSAACGGGSCRHGRSVGVISVSLCKQEMTVKTASSADQLCMTSSATTMRRTGKEGTIGLQCVRLLCFWRYESKVVTRILSRVKNVQNSINTRVSFVFHVYTDTALCFIGLVLLTVWLLCCLQWANLKRLFAISDFLKAKWLC